MNLCATLGGNVGAPECDVEMGALKTIIFTRGREFTADEVADSDALQAALQASALLANDDNNKVFVFPVFHRVTDNTGDPNVETLDDGLEQINVEPVPKYLLESVIGFCQAQSLSRFNGWRGKMYVIDSNQRFFFVRKSDGGAKGFSTGTVYTDAPRFTGYTGAKTIKTRVSFAAISEFQSGLGAVNASFDAQGLTNIVNVTLKQVAAAAGDVFTIGGSINCSGTNIYAAYKTPLNNADAWLVKRADTGAVVEIESVATDDVNGGWDITLATGVATGTKLLIQFVAPGVLAELSTPVEGIEAVPLLVTKAA